MSDWFGPDIKYDRVTRFDWGVYIVSITYCLTFVMLTVCKLWFTKPQKSIFKSIRLLSTLHSAFYLVYFVAWWPERTIDNTKPNRVAAYIGLFLAQISFYILMTLRLYQTFNSTIYELSKLQIMFFEALASLLTLSWIVWFTQDIYIDYDPARKDKVQQRRLFNFIVLPIIFGTSCVYGFILIWLFVYNLYKLILSQRQSIHIWNDKRITTSISMSGSFNHTSFHGANFSKEESSRSKNMAQSPSTSNTNYNTMDRMSNNNQNDDNNIELNEKQKSLLATMVKNSILGIIAIVLYQSFFFMGPIVVEDYRIEVIYKGSMALVVFLEMLCVYLSFKSNDKTYQCLCGKCHRLCESCLSGCVEKKVKELHQKDFDLYDTSKVLLEEVSLTQQSLSLNAFINDK